jgi:hypothetical protein
MHYNASSFSVGHFSPKQFGRFSFDPIIKKRITAIQTAPGNNLHAKIFQDALLTATDNDLILYEEWKRRDAEREYSHLKPNKAFNVRELCSQTLKLRGSPISPGLLHVSWGVFLSGSSRHSSQ